MTTYIDELESQFGDTYYDDYGDNYDDLDEARRNPGRGRRSTPPPPPPPPSLPPGRGAVTGDQLRQASLTNQLAGLRRDVTVLQGRIGDVNGAVDSVRAAVAREAGVRRRTIDAVRGDLQQTKMLSVLLPTLTQQTTTALASDGDSEVKVLTPSSNPLAQMLPLLAVLSPGGAEGGRGGFGDTSTLLLLAVAMQNRS